MTKETIFDEEKKARKSAKEVLKLAKKQEKEKLNNGFVYVSVDCKTKILKKLNN